MRTGKSLVTLQHWQRTGDEDLLIIAPGGVIRTWIGAIELDVDCPVMTYLWQSSKRTPTADFLSHTGKRILLMNVEALSGVEAARELCLAFLTRSATIVIDESVVIKSNTAKRSRFVIDYLAPKAHHRLILSGLPTPRSPLDLYAQFDFLDRDILGYRTYTDFENAHALKQRMKVGGRQFDIVVGYKGEDVLAAKIAPHSFRCLLSDCYDLPASEYTTLEVEMTEEQAEAYAAMKADATALLSSGQHVTATQVVTQILRMHQILCGHTTDENGVEAVLPSRRIKTLIDYIENYDGKAIVWCSYDADVRSVSAALVEEYGDKAVARFWGGNVLTREAEEATFKNNRQCRFMVATAAAGGRGRTWDMADMTIYYSNTPDLDHRMQSEERGKNVGKMSPMLYIDMVVPGTVDAKMLSALRAKINMSSAITGDAWQAWVV